MKWTRLYAAIAASGIVILCIACSADTVPVENKAPLTAARAAGLVETTPSVAPGTFDHSALERLLATYVDDNGWVDYSGLARDRFALDAYLTTLANANPQSFRNDNERLAFWINAYNAFTLRDALDDVYHKVSGVKEVSGFFNRKKHRIANEDLTLDDIEKRGRDFRNPRIHFTVVCASTSCPKLQRFTYKGAQLDEQLERVTREFLMDEQRGMRVDRKSNQLYVSSLFKWYAADFQGKTGKVAFVVELTRAAVTGGKTLSYIEGYVAPDVAQFIKEKKPGVHFLDYDWSLNAQETHRSAHGATP